MNYDFRSEQSEETNERAGCRITRSRDSSKCRKRLGYVVYRKTWLKRTLETYNCYHVCTTVIVKLRYTFV